MILFHDDWLKYPDAIIDYQTKNESFLRLAQLYQSMGIRNCAFHLSLMQPELQGVDPFDETLSQEMQTLIGLECRYNPWYFYREIIRLDMVGGVLGPFQANRGNIALFWSFLNHIDAALIQPRQTGKSTSVDCQTIWLEYIAGRRLTMMLLTKDDKLRSENIDRLKGIRGNLPPYLLVMRSDDSDNTEELTCNRYRNKLITGVARNSEQAANNLGRGLTAPVFQCDEGPFISFIGITLPAALASGSAAVDQAKANGQPYGRIYTTTAGKKDDRDGSYMYELIHSGTVWSEHYFDAANEEELRHRVKVNGTSRSPLLNITMSHRQLGYDDEWLYRKIAESKATGEAAERDFLNIWTSGTQRSPLSVALNELIFKSTIEPKHQEVSKDGYILKWYIDEEEKEELLEEGHIVFGMDTSDAVGRDAIALVGVDVRNLEVVCAGTYNETNLIRFGMYIVSLLVKYLNSTLIIERKSTASTLIDLMILHLPKYGQDPFRRIFNKIVEEASERPEEYTEVVRFHDSRSEAFYDRRKAAFGFVTTADRRDVLYVNVLQNAAKQGGHAVRDSVLSSEIRGLVEKNGRIDHTKSGHDDMVMAWLLSHWLITLGRNLDHYGISQSVTLRQVGRNGRPMSEEELEMRERQDYLLQEIDELVEKLKNTSDEILAMKYEMRLRNLSGRVEMESDNEGVSLDAMIKQASEDRLKRRRVQTQQRGLYNEGGNRPINFRFHQSRPYSPW